MLNIIRPLQTYCISGGDFVRSSWFILLVSDDCVSLEFSLKFSFDCLRHSWRFVIIIIELFTATHSLRDKSYHVKPRLYRPLRFAWRQCENHLWCKGEREKETKMDQNFWFNFSKFREMRMQNEYNDGKRYDKVD